MTAQDRLRAARGFVLDVDGTLVLGTRDGGDFTPLPGAVELTALLADRRVPYAVFTNGSAKSPRYYVDALRAVSLTIPDKGVLTPVSSAIDVLTDAMSSHLSYEERELVEPLARLGY